MGFSISLSLNPAASFASPTAGCVSEGQEATRALLKEQEQLESCPWTLQREENPPDPVAQKSCTAILGCLDPWSMSFCRQRDQLFLPGRNMLWSL